jgi:hypothetical protein
MKEMSQAGKSYSMERFSTFHLLELSSLDQLPLIMKILFTYFTKQAALMRRSTVLSLSLQSVFPVSGFEFGLEIIAVLYALTL